MLSQGQRSAWQVLPHCDVPAIEWCHQWPTQACFSQLDSPMGPAVLAHDAGALYALHFTGNAGAEALAELQQCIPAALPTLPANAWLGAWLQHLPPPGRLVATGTPFQHRVWQQLLRIPTGWLVTYGAIADALGQPGAARAVGQAVGQNPLGGWIPCHRVLPAQGIGHYHWGGQDTKMALLSREGINLANR